MHADASVQVVHSQSLPEDFEAAVRSADILVAAVGKPGIIKGEWVKEGAVGACTSAYTLVWGIYRV